MYWRRGWEPLYRRRRNEAKPCGSNYGMWKSNTGQYDIALPLFISLGHWVSLGLGRSRLSSRWQSSLRWFRQWRVRQSAMLASGGTTAAGSCFQERKIDGFSRRVGRTAITGSDWICEAVGRTEHWHNPTCVPLRPMLRFNRKCERRCSVQLEPSHTSAKNRP